MQDTLIIIIAVVFFLVANKLERDFRDRFDRTDEQLNKVIVGIESLGRELERLKK